MEYRANVYDGTSAVQCCKGIVRRGVEGIGGGKKMGWWEGFSVAEEVVTERYECREHVAAVEESGRGAVVDEFAEVLPEASSEVQEDRSEFHV